MHNKNYLLVLNYDSAIMGRLSFYREKRVKLLPIISVLLTTSLASYALAAEPEALPRDIRIFLTNMEDCEHMAGEVDNTLPPEALQKNINEANRTCKLAKRQYEHLRQKYQGQGAVENIISPYGTTMNSSL